MKWYTDRLKALESEAPILSVCGDDCAVCPRFLAQTGKELRETALFWYRAGWRDRVVGNDEIRCTGCGCRPTCSFMLLPCTRAHGVGACRDCPEFECDKVRDTYERSEAKKRQCESACDSPEEFRMLCRAFYEKERNMRGVGMRFDREYPNEANGTNHVSVIAREDWKREMEMRSEAHRKGAVLYVHGKGGSAAECAHYRPLFPDRAVIGLDYKTFSPWETGAEIHAAVEELKAAHESILLIANSIGAFFSMNAGVDRMIEGACFISPIVDMEKLIADMMQWANVTEAALEARGVIPTAFGEDLSWDYLCYVRSHPIRWTAPTRILYGSRDNLTSLETIRDFAKKHDAVLSVMEGGEHWFHTGEQMRFLDDWIVGK